MACRTLDSEARPHTSPAEAGQIEMAARHRRTQMLRGMGPHAPDRDPPVDQFRGGDTIILASKPKADGYVGAPRKAGENTGDPDAGNLRTQASGGLLHGEADEVTHGLFE